jgi:dihydroorotate dehydrogenase electron transfer subunit
LNQALAKVISNSEVMPGVSLIWLESPQIASTAKPGQFIMLQCGEDNLLRRPLSIHNVDDNRSSLAVLFSIVGKGTKWLSQRQPGENIDILGPLGNGYSINPASRNLLLVGGGIGIAPLPFLARTAIDNKCDVTILMGASTTEQICPDYLLPDGVDCIITTNDGSAGEKGMLTDSFRGFAAFTTANQIFTCGPSPMYRAMAQMPELKGKPVQVSLEVRMGCGFGLCYGCTVKTKTGSKQICKDGPVFELDEILWDELVDI